MPRLAVAAILLSLSSSAVMAQAVVCPNLSEIVAKADYPPKALAAGLLEGSAVVSFNVLPNGSVSEPVLIESTHQVFGEQALAMARRITCFPRSETANVRLPVKFAMPQSGQQSAPTRNRCTPTEGFAAQAGFPRDAADLGLAKGSAVVVVHMSSTGEKTYRVEKASHPAFAAAAMRAVVHMSCVNADGETDIPVPFDFLLAQ